MGVAAHQHLVARHEPGMHDFLFMTGRHLRPRGRVAVRDHRRDFSAEAPFVKLERRFTLSVERQVWIPLHRRAPSRFALIFNRLRSLAL